MGWRKPADRELLHAIVGTFRGDADCSFAQLAQIPERAWKQTDYWLDASGLALYFLDEVYRLGIMDAVHPATLERLRLDLRRNRQRMDVLFEEFAAINTAFQQAGILYANHKGFTLCPGSCPLPELRHQSDFDFLIAQEHLGRARECLQARGYQLVVATTKAWEFKRNNSTNNRGWDNYSAGTYRSVELHFQPEGAVRGAGHDRRLDFLRAWHWAGSSFPALSSADQLIAQALHLFGHLRSESTRPSWLLEFRRHALARRDDAAFWIEVQQLAMGNRYAPMALGLSVMLAAKLFGEFAPRDFVRWTAEALPPAVRLWGEHYGVQAVLADFPGTKLHLLLEPELELLETTPHHAARRRPRPIQRARGVFLSGPEHTFADRLSLSLARTRYICFRFRFYVTEAGRYLRERNRWKRLLAQQSTLAPASRFANVREMTKPKQLHDKFHSTPL